MGQRPPSAMDFGTELADHIGSAGKTQRHMRQGIFCTPFQKHSKLHLRHHLLTGRTVGHTKVGGSSLY